MSRIKYSQEQIDFLLNNYKGISSRELAERFTKEFGTKVTEKQMLSFKETRKLKSGYRRTGNVLFTPSQEKFIRNNYKGISSKELTNQLNEKFGANFKVTQLQAFKTRYKLRSGYNTQFKKGQEPANKGLKWDEYMPLEAQERCKSTQFKRGERPLNHRPIGSERITIDGYVEVKVKEPDVWRLKHYVVWEKVNGKVPKGYRFLFLDGDSTNVDIENLKLVPMAVGVIMNKRGLYTRGCSDLNEAGSLVAEILHKTYSLKKGNINENEKTPK